MDESKKVGTNEVQTKTAPVATGAQPSTQAQTPPASELQTSSAETSKAAATSTDAQNPAVAQQGVQPISPATTAARKRSSGVLDELKQLQKDVKEFKPSDLIIPVMSIIILVLLSVFVYIPMISKAIEYRNESLEIQEKIEKLNSLDTQLSNVDVTQQQRDLADSRKVIPFSLQVSDFVQYVNELADSKKLDFREIVAGDIQIRGDNENKSTDPVIRGVNGPLKYVGSLSNIVTFLDELQSVSPYIISSDDIEIKRTLSGGDEWELSLVTTGYYLNKGSLPKLTVYSPFISYSQFSDILEIFKDKADNTEAE